LGVAQLCNLSQLTATYHNFTIIIILEGCATLLSHFQGFAPHLNSSPIWCRCFRHATPRNLDQIRKATPRCKAHILANNLTYRLYRYSKTRITLYHFENTTMQTWSQHVQVGTTWRLRNQIARFIAQCTRLDELYPMITNIFRKTQPTPKLCPLNQVSSLKSAKFSFFSHNFLPNEYF
jgi:hypothetical protein